MRGRCQNCHRHPTELYPCACFYGCSTLICNYCGIKCGKCKTKFLWLHKRYALPPNTNINSKLNLTNWICLYCAVNFADDKKSINNKHERKLLILSDNTLCVISGELVLGASIRKNYYGKRVIRCQDNVYRLL